ncbi:hypothetical protein SVIOM74S_03871 [Streptomyces violarus]
MNSTPWIWEITMVLPVSKAYFAMIATVKTSSQIAVT